MVIWPNSTGMVPEWSPTKIVQMVLIGCISKSPGQKVGFQNAIFKNLSETTRLALHIWYIASSRGPLPKLFKLCPWGQNRPRLGGHNFTLSFIRISSNDIYSWTANGNLTKHNRNGHCVVPYQNCLNGSDFGCISRSQGQKIGFQKAIFNILLVWNYKAQSFHIWYIHGLFDKFVELCNKSVSFKYFSLKFGHVIYLPDVTTLFEFHHTLLVL